VQETNFTIAAFSKIRKHDRKLHTAVRHLVIRTAVHDSQG